MGLSNSEEVELGLGGVKGTRDEDPLVGTTVEKEDRDPVLDDLSPRRPISAQVHD